MRTRLGLIWATAMSFYDAVAYQTWPLRAALVDLGRGVLERFRPPARTGLVTVADATEFIDEIRESASASTDLDPGNTETSPIFDVLTQEWPALYSRRLKALTWETAEYEIQWRGLTSMLELDWVCLHCAGEDHATCAGCPCPCAMVVAA